MTWDITLGWVLLLFNCCIRPFYASCRVTLGAFYVDVRSGTFAHVLGPAPDVCTRTSSSLLKAHVEPTSAFGRVGELKMGNNNQQGGQGQGGQGQTPNQGGQGGQRQDDQRQGNEQGQRGPGQSPDQDEEEGQGGQNQRGRGEQ